MSLRETLEGARSEASQSSSAKPETAPAKKGASKRSTAKAKPTRAKAASVRTASRSGKKATATPSLLGVKKTKEQKEAERSERRKRREEEDYKNQAFQILLSQNPDYKKSERIWWVLLAIGFVATLVSLAVSLIFPATSDSGVSTRDIASFISLIVAYAFIIAGFVFDWIVRRPLRKETEKKLQGMSQKKISDLLARARKAELERKAAKEAAKKGKK